MNLQFDSLDELRQFLTFAGYEKGGEMHVTVQADTSQLAADLKAVAEAAGVDVAALSAPSPQPDATDLAEAAKNTGGTPGDAKPKRRTKAQIEADKAAAPAEAVASAGTDETPKGGDSPFDTTQQPISTEHASLNTTQTKPVETAEQPVDDTDVKLYIAGRVGALGIITPVAHLAACRHFISVHSMAPYIRSMQLIDGPGEVAMYNDGHRAQHLASMEIINRSLGKSALPHEVAAADISGDE